MPLAADITPDDLKVFLQEADNADLLQEIFRGAHTLKGSSGMLGFTSMASLTHAMEDLLDRVRKHTLQVTPELVDALLASLDGLKALKSALAEGGDTDIDVAPLVAMLRAAADDGAAPAAAAAAAESLTLEPAAAEQLAAALAAGHSAHHVRVSLEQTDWAAVRCFQIVNELAGLGDVLASVPSQQAIEAEQVGQRIEVLVVSAHDAAKLREALATVPELAQIDIADWDASAPAAAPAEHPASDAAKGAREQADAAHKIDTPQTVRIDVERLDQLMNMVGELVIDRTRLAQIGRTLQGRYKEDDQARQLVEMTTHVTKVIDALHESMMQVRMLPIGLLFSKFPRLVRDLARSLEKPVDFVVEGDGTEIDRSVIEKIKDPLVHLIRNAVDHGVESPADRAAAGKPATATVRLAAQHESGHILITLDDDGGGIDPVKIREAAVRRGALTAEAAERLSDQESVELIFEPGLSTAQQTTEVSGRGVGMDIVRRYIEELNGRVEVHSTVGQGTRFSLRLPLTLATFGGLLVRSGGRTYALPLSFVQETVKPDPSSLGTVLTKSVMHLRGGVMPLLRLNEAMLHTGTQRAPVRATEPLFAVVVRAGDGENDRPVAIGVDALIDQQDLVVKTLGGYMGKTRGIAGASILGDGDVVLIVDVPSLIKPALQSADATAGEATERKHTWAA